MKKKFLLLMYFLSPMLLYAQGFQVNLQGQQQQAMGGAGTGAALDAASVFYNPGAISALEENSVIVGASMTIANSTYLDKASGDVSHTESPPSFPFAAYGVFGKTDSKLRFGMGIYTPFGSTVKWEDEWTGRFVLTRLTLSATFFQPTVSYKFSDKFSAGVGFVYGLGMVNLQRDIPVLKSDGTYSSAQLKGTANGFGFNAGLYFKPTEKLSIGLTYRSQVNMKLNSGDATFDVPPALATSFPNGNFSAEIPLPQVLTLGFAVKASEKVTIVADVNYIGWSSYDTLAFDYENNTPALKDTKSARMYENAWAFRLGGQFQANEKLKIRLGANYEVTPVQDGYLTPEVPDANRFNITGGLGYKFSDKFNADASFSFINFMERSDTNKENNMSGTYKTYIFVPGLSLSYTF